MTTDLHPWRCANEACPSRRSDAKGQIVMKGENVPGWRGEGYCHQCHHYTFVEVTPEGWPQYLLRPAASRGLALTY